MLGLPEIVRVLPHRHPVLMIDRVEHLEPGRRITAIKAITAAEPCYAGVADDAAQEDYAFPVSLLIEAFGQAGALLWLYSARLDGDPPAGLPLFGAARGFRVDRHAYPGDVLELAVELDSAKGDTAFLSGEIRVRGDRVATVGSMLAVARGAVPDPIVTTD